MKKEHKNFVKHTLELAKKTKATGKRLRPIAVFWPTGGKPKAVPLDVDTVPMQQLSLAATRGIARLLNAEAVLAVYEGYHEKPGVAKDEECILMLYVNIAGEKVLYRQAFRKQGGQVIFDELFVASGDDITGNIADLFDRQFEILPPKGTC